MIGIVRTSFWHRLPRRFTTLMGTVVLLGVAPPFGASQTSPHGPLKFPCEDCHTAASWSVMPSPPIFKHEKTGFLLAGQHSVVACLQCHTTLQFAVTGKACADCHDDVHHGELGITCDRCHAPNSWLVPDMVERHNVTRFALVGAHRTANCMQCHVNQQKHQFVGIRTDCVGCHQADYDATKSPGHRAAGFGVDCVSCHSVSAFQWGSNFDHTKTGFPLTGAHAAVACSQCHPGGNFTTASPDCYSCHAPQFTSAASPPHTGFPTACATCHTTNAWQPASFDHNKTNFPLTGAHVAVVCASCHKNNIYAGTSIVCSSCHQADFTNAKNPSHLGYPTDCVPCHSTTAWQPATFDHNKTNFPLTGAHVAVVCASCHKNNVYAGTSTDCYACHQTDFTTAANPSHAGFVTACATCHTTNAWQPATFDHNKTNFPLTGAHVAVVCASCHKNNVYAGTSTDCYACHQTDFTTAANPSHAGFVTACATCHTTNAWQPASFDHSTTAFALTGAHTSTACASCHVNNVFKGTPATCGASTCHLNTYNTTNPAHNSGGFGIDCQSCHSTTAWVPYTWNLSNHGSWFPIASGNRHGPTVWPAGCNTCHMTSNYKDFSCIDCHTHNQPTTDAQHSGRANYRYDSASCYSCHPRGSGG